MRSSSSALGLLPSAAVLALTDKENATHVIELAGGNGSSSSSSSTVPSAGKRRRDEGLRINTERRRRRQEQLSRHGRKAPLQTEREWRRETTERDQSEPDVDTTPRQSFAAGSATVSFQRRLARPRDPLAVPLDILVHRHPHWQGLSLPAIKHALRARGPALAHALHATRASPISALPTILDALISEDLRADMPSHFFAVYSKTSQSRPTQARRTVTIFPAHDAVFQAYCAKLAPMPPAAAIPGPDTPLAADGRSIETTLPVVPLCLPSPRTFGLLQHYLYHNDPDALGASLLPALPATASESADRAQTIRDLAQQIAATHGPAKINEHVLQAHGLWSNIVVLGITDEGLWTALDFFWAVLMSALYLATLARPAEHIILGSSQPEPHPVSAVCGPGPAFSSVPTELSASSSCTESETDGNTSDSTALTTPPTSPLVSKASFDDDLMDTSC
ncbi:hypothetical protein BKA62DRAFT_430335 [Auriculariales sp. MPI-PUGE-AT-0066]|nr:hypothetical protein BKA62DRAFT_430335 [Auriculariales sp. MPI-PUGE-AT-0066]